MIASQRSNRAGDDVGALVGVADDLLAQLLRLQQRAADGFLLVADLVKIGHDDFQLALQLVVFTIKLSIFINEELDVVVHLGGAVSFKRFGKRLAFQFMRCEHSCISFIESGRRHGVNRPRAAEAALPSQASR